MKTCLLLIMFPLFTLLLKAQADTTTAIIKTTSSASARPMTSTINVNVADTAKGNKPATKTGISSTDTEIRGMGWLLVFSPVIIFLAISISLRPQLKGFNLTEALQDDQQGKKIIPNPEYTSANLQALEKAPAMAAILFPTIEVSDGNYPKSSSRYIALITSALTWTIALCLTSYFIYGYIKTGNAPELNKLTDVVLTLGIGVVPYVFNKVSEAAKK